MREHLISAVVNIVCGLVAAVMYDWFKGRQSVKAAPPAAGSSIEADLPRGRLAARTRAGESAEKTAAGRFEPNAVSEDLSYGAPPRQPAAGRDERLPAPRSGGLLRSLLGLIVIAAVGFAAALALHRLGVGAFRPSLPTLLWHAAIIAVSMGVFVYLFGRRRRLGG